MSEQLGTQQRPLRVAVVGAGPSGFYAAEALFTSEMTVKVDMFDRLPSPFGLVRYGVAPDHYKIKNVIKIYEKIAARENFSFLGNVKVGKDISAAELQTYYDAVIFSCGSEKEKTLGIPGEDLAGSYAASEFVWWYNGHPDCVNNKFDLSKEIAVVIGQGNVALDVARILCKTVDELKMTDITQAALDALAQSKVREVHLIGRRGPAQTAFTPVEIREFGALAECDVVVNPDELVLNDASKTELADPRNAPKKKNYDILGGFARMPIGKKRKRLIIHFYESPRELKGSGAVEKLVLEKNELSGEPGKQKAKGTGKLKEMNCGVFFRSVGYRGAPIPGVPFREDWAVLPNEGGRITDNGKPLSGLYCAGWIKRGPSGIIGTNKPCSQETAQNLLADVPNLPPCPQPDTNKVIEFLTKKGIKVVSFKDWQKIDAAEIARGAKVGKPREKFLLVSEMLSVV